MQGGKNNRGKFHENEKRGRQNFKIADQVLLVVLRQQLGGPPKPERFVYEWRGKPAGGELRQSLLATGDLDCV